MKLLSGVAIFFLDIRMKQNKILKLSQMFSLTHALTIFFAVPAWDLN